MLIDLTKSPFPLFPCLRDMASQYVQNQLYPAYTSTHPLLCIAYQYDHYPQFNTFSVPTTILSSTVNPRHASSQLAPYHPSHAAQRRMISSKIVESIKEISDLMSHLTFWRERIHQLEHHRASYPAYSSLAEYATEKTIQCHIPGPNARIVPRVIRQVTRGRSWPEQEDLDPNGHGVTWKVKQWSSHEEVKLVIAEDRVVTLETELKGACTMRDAWTLALQKLQY